MKIDFGLKRKKKKSAEIYFSLFSFRQFVLVFLAFCFVITSMFSLFFYGGFGMIFEILDLAEELKHRAIQTFGNVIFISFLVTIVYNIFKWFTVKIPITKLLDATHKVMSGDFSVRVKFSRPFRIVNEFNILGDAFNKMTEELSSIETLKNDFIANVSHELKTPLAVISSYSTMIQNPELSKEERLEYAQVITNASSNLSELITSILRLNKLENQQIFPEKNRYDLGEQICECMINFENEWERKKLNIETDISEDVIINADGELLSLVWSNLISNAIKFTDEGDTVFVSLEKKGNEAVIKVRDTGCGMSEKVRDRVFEKFYQGDSSRSTKGNGLGLALVKRILDITNGTITVQSTEGEGSEFTVTVSLE